MKARYLRKLIPAGQRANINWTEWDQALRFTPTPPPTTADSSSAEPLCNLLSKVPIRLQGRPDDGEHNLLNFLVVPLLDKETLCDTTGDLALPDSEERNTVNKFRETYSGLQVLDATPREILDLWIHLQKFCRKRAQVNGDSNKEEWLRMLVEYALPAMEEQDFLTEEDQEILPLVSQETRDSHP